MSATIFCCGSIIPYRPRPLDHEAKFTTFMGWAHRQKLTPPPPSPDNSSTPTFQSAPFAVQLVRQVNYGPQESVRYFVPAGGDRGNSDFVEVTESDLIKGNFEKLNSYKNFRCGMHNRFFEVNLYQKNPTNAHHWRSNLARPSRDIDLAFRRNQQEQQRIEPTGGSVAEQEKSLDDKNPDNAPSEKVANIDREPTEDSTACDKECGYCGRCDY